MEFVDVIIFLVFALAAYLFAFHVSWTRYLYLALQIVF